MKWWKKCRKLVKGRMKKRRQGKEKRPKCGALWENWKMATPFVMIGQNLVGVNAASGNARNRSGQTTRMREETEFEVSSWRQALPMKSRQEEQKGIAEGIERCKMYFIEWVDVVH